MTIVAAATVAWSALGSSPGAPGASQGTPTISSSTSQVFTVGDPPQSARPIIITDVALAPQITAANDIRIRIPSALSMIWDTTQSVNVVGQARRKVSSVITYEDGGRTMVIDVVTDFAGGDRITVNQAGFAGFWSISPPSNLELMVFNDGVATSTDDQSIEIVGLPFGVSVAPAVVAADTLPSNGGSYTVDFTATNLGNGTDDFDLLTSAIPGTVVTVLSLSGVGVTQGAVPDSARVSGLASGDSTVVTVTYAVAMAPPGTSDTLFLTARSAGEPTATGQGRLELSVIRPDLTMAKAVTPTGTQSPGTELTYTVSVTNSGNAAAAAVAVLDSLPTEVQFRVGSVTTTLPPGVTATVEYSGDNGVTWAYAPVPAGCGGPIDYDACVTHIRLVLQDELPFAAPDNVASLEFAAAIR